jgi:hypothetical protein
MTVVEEILYVQSHDSLALALVLELSLVAVLLVSMPFYLLLLQLGNRTTHPPWLLLVGLFIQVSAARSYLEGLGGTQSLSLITDERFWKHRLAQKVRGCRACSGSPGLRGEWA